MPLKIYRFSHINPSLKEKVRVTNFFFVTRAAISFFLAGQKPRNLLISTKPLLKNKIGSQFLATSCICSSCSLFRSKEIPVKRVGIKSTVSLSELWTYASVAAAYSPRGLTSGVVRGWPMADLRARQNLLMPYPRDRQGGKYPTVARSRGGGTRCSWNWLMH